MAPTEPRPVELPEQLLDITALAERLGVAPRHVRRLVAERRIPFIKLGPPDPLRPGRGGRLARRLPATARTGGLTRAGCQTPPLP